MTDFWKTGLSARETFYATWASDNKTVAELAKKCNDSIVSAIIKIIGPMTEVVIADIILEIGAVLDAVSE